MSKDIHHDHTIASGLNRRDILKRGCLGMLGALPMLALGNMAQAATIALPREGDFKIAFRNQNTGESFNGTYRVGHKYLPEAFERINHVLRDHRTNEAFPIDPRAMDILYMVKQKSNSKGQFEILSGYRSPKTNAMLARTTNGVARNSLHLTGQAIDTRLPGYSTSSLNRIARGLQAGGVGYYPKSNFVHVDTGQIRHW